MDGVIDECQIGLEALELTGSSQEVVCVPESKVFSCGASEAMVANELDYILTVANGVLNLLE